jgi:hypothetical protein
MTLERKQLKKEADQVPSRLRGRQLGAERRGQILIGPRLLIDQTQGDQRLLTMRVHTGIMPWRRRTEFSLLPCQTVETDAVVHV